MGRDPLLLFISGARTHTHIKTNFIWSMRERGVCVCVMRATTNERELHTQTFTTPYDEEDLIRSNIYRRHCIRSLYMGVHNIIFTRKKSKTCRFTLPSLLRGWQITTLSIPIKLLALQPKPPQYYYYYTGLSHNTFQLYIHPLHREFLWIIINYLIHISIIYLDRFIIKTFR